MYPLKFENIYFEKIWGGKELSKYRTNVDSSKGIGESWDVACHPNGISIIRNGKYKGMSLKELIELKGSAILGSKVSKGVFPLLVKILNTADKLSVQVHPDDDYALENEGEMGKTEVWYIIDAEEDSYIILGVDNCSKEEFRKQILEGNPENCMKRIGVKKGDVFHIKSGLIHGMSGGLLIAEIQQNSDTTYRVYDYNRGRQLHIDKALDVIDFNLEGRRCEGIRSEYSTYIKTIYCSDKYFTLELLDIKTQLITSSDLEKFHIYTCVEGSGYMEYDRGRETINMLDSILIPAALGEYKLVGQMKLLKSHI